MDFKIVSCKGTETFQTTATAAEWLEEMQPGVAEVDVDGHTVELVCHDEEGWEDSEALRVQLRCAARDARAMAVAAQ